MWRGWWGAAACEGAACEGALGASLRASLLRTTLGTSLLLLGTSLLLLLLLLLSLLLQMRLRLLTLGNTHLGTSSSTRGGGYFDRMGVGGIATALNAVSGRKERVEALNEMWEASERLETREMTPGVSSVWLLKSFIMSRNRLYTSGLSLNWIFTWSRYVSASVTLSARYTLVCEWFRGGKCIWCMCSMSPAGEGCAPG